MILNLLMVFPFRILILRLRMANWFFKEITFKTALVEATLSKMIWLNNLPAKFSFQ